MKRLFALLLLLALTGAAHAQTTRYKWQRAAVGTQAIEVVFATHIDVECKAQGESRMSVVTAPKSGELTAAKAEGFSEFTGQYAKCNGKRVEGLRVQYKAREGFKGRDRFTFLVVYSDGETRRYEIDMTVH